MQLVAYGAQDIYLTGNPMITYFKVVYRRHTNFAMESIQQTFNGNANFNSRVTALISRNGDLVSGVTLEATLPAAQANERYVDDVGHHLIQQVDVEIGGQLIDRHYADWLEIWAQLTVPAGHEAGYRKMIGQSQTSERVLAANINAPSGLQAAGAADAAGAQSAEASDRKVYVPLQFWFCRNVGLALPLIALQYHEVKITVQFAQASHVTVLESDASQTAATVGAITYGNAGSTPTNALEASLWVDYIYLDTDERRRFAQVSHEYLIEQLQFTGDESYDAGATNKAVTLNFNHPVKELVWVCKESSRVPNGEVAVGTNVGVNDTAVAATAFSSVNEHSNYTTISAQNCNGVAATVGGAADAGVSSGLAKNPTSSEGLVFGLNPVASAKLQLNGHDRFTTRKGDYFNLVETRCHTRIPQSPGINVYSFALKPEDHQPSGTCNFSRIDNARLQLTLLGVFLSGGVIKVYATNYNVLRIMSGMGGLAYSN